MHATRTGGFPIGLRRGSGDWQGSLDRLLDFMVHNGFSFVDLGPSPVEEILQVRDAGLGIGSVDLKRWKEMLSPDRDRQDLAVTQNIEHVRAVAGTGVNLFLAVVTPEDTSLTRRQNFNLALDAYGRLASAVASAGVRILFEGAPGRPPWFPALACTPADLRLFFAAVSERFGKAASNVLGINFDPSHLVRMGIDPPRFLGEFAPRIHHVHAKDTLLLSDALYEHGHLQQATFAPPRGFGGYAWRYTIPGHGSVPWPALLSILRDRGYAGRVSIELEDEQFNGSEAGEQEGFIASRDFLASC